MACTHTHTHTHALTHSCTHALTHTHACMHTHTHTHTYAYIHTCMHTHTCGHTGMHTHTHTCRQTHIYIKNQDGQTTFSMSPQDLLLYWTITLVDSAPVGVNCLEFCLCNFRLLVQLHFKVRLLLLI